MPYSTDCLCSSCVATREETLRLADLERRVEAIEKSSRELGDRTAGLVEYGGKPFNELLGMFQVPPDDYSVEIDPFLDDPTSEAHGEILSGSSDLSPAEGFSEEPALIPSRAEAPQERGNSSPVCSTCNDTHVMPATGWPCTRCPVPCLDCGGKPLGPFCSTTPCPCECHRKPTREEIPECQHPADMQYVDHNGELQCAICDPITPDMLAAAMRTGERVGAERFRERAIEAFSSPLGWLCLDHGGEEAERIVDRLRNLPTEESET